jgi:uncharacterized protein YxjI
VLSRLNKAGRCTRTLYCAGSQGSFLGWQYTISQGERVVAALSKQGILPSTFEVDTADGEDDLFLLCLVLAIEQIHRERKRR